MEKEINEMTINESMTPGSVKEQVQMIQQLMKDVMIKDEHYGIIPNINSKKPTLLKAGAEKLLLLFNLAPHYEVKETNLENYHKEYLVKCILTNKISGNFIGDGEGFCTSLESKYRYRWIKDENDWKKKTKVENENIADVHNTVLKMACKRALVAAVLNAVAASDIFTQDLEDMSANASVNEPKVGKLNDKWRDEYKEKVRVLLGDDLTNEDIKSDCKLMFSVDDWTTLDYKTAAEFYAHVKEKREKLDKTKGV